MVAREAPKREKAVKEELLQDEVILLDEVMLLDHITQDAADDEFISLASPRKAARRE